MAHAVPRVYRGGRRAEIGAVAVAVRRAEEGGGTAAAAMRRAEKGGGAAAVRWAEGGAVVPAVHRTEGEEVALWACTRRRE